MRGVVIPQWIYRLEPSTTNISWMNEVYRTQFNANIVELSVQKDRVRSIGGSALLVLKVYEGHSDKYKGLIARTGLGILDDVTLVKGSGVGDDFLQEPWDDEFTPSVAQYVHDNRRIFESQRDLRQAFEVYLND